MTRPETRILIIDDEPNHRLMLRLHLAEAGFHPVEAENGQQGLACLEREEFALILLDLKMPVMDGYGFLADLRRQGKGTPVVVITAFSNVRTAVEAMKLGATEFLTKPVDPAELLDLVETLLRSRPRLLCPPAVVTTASKEFARPTDWARLSTCWRWSRRRMPLFLSWENPEPARSW